MKKIEKPPVCSCLGCGRVKKFSWSEVSSGECLPNKGKRCDQCKCRKGWKVLEETATQCA